MNIRDWFAFCEIAWTQRSLQDNLMEKNDNKYKEKNGRHERQMKVNYFSSIHAFLLLPRAEEGISSRTDYFH